MIHKDYKKKSTNIFAVATKKNSIYSPHLELVSIYFSSKM